MTQEQKDKLLKYLCMALPYGVMVNYGGYEGCDYKLTLTTLQDFPIEDLKPYLRPLSSMTEEEWRECVNLGIGDEFEDSYGEHRHLLPSYRLYDWFNAHHFDYRGLIEKVLAIEVTEDNNYYKY